MKINPRVLLALFLFCRGYCFSVTSDEVLNNIEKVYAGITDITFSFTQKMTIKMTGETESVSGTAAFKKPDKFRITNKKPREQVIACDGKKMYLYSKKLNQVTIEDPAGQNQLPRQFFDFSSVIGGLRAGYGIKIQKEESKYFILSCVPKDSADENSKLRLWISKNKYLLERMETSTGVTVTVISVSGIKINTGAGDGRFEFKIPKGADVVSPQ